MGQRPRDGTTLCRQANRRACPGDGHEVSRRPAQRDRGDHCYYSDRLLETPAVRPHGLDADREGNIWFTAIDGGYIGKLDPVTGDVDEYQIPDSQVGGPHTPLFDQKGMLWFTMNRDNRIGRINPKTRDVKIVPTPSAGPYGIVVDSQGVPFVAMLRSEGRLASVDPESMEIREYPLNSPEARPRRIAVTSDNLIWYTDFARGYLGRLDPVTGKASEWLSPSGPRSNPYGIATVGNIVWYSESGVKPNTLVRFDPSAEEFQSWEIPSGGGVVRHMVAAPNGNLWLACSGVNGIALVEVEYN